MILTTEKIYKYAVVLGCMPWVLFSFGCTGKILAPVSWRNPLRLNPPVNQQKTFTHQPITVNATQAANDCQPTGHSLSPWLWPTQTHAYRKTFSRTGRQGLDLFGQRGQAVVAANAGKVIYSGAGTQGYQGDLIIIQHNEAYLSIYAQNQRRWVTTDTPVQRGQKIADMGGNLQNALLHFEISCYQKTVPPLHYLSQGQGYAR